MRESKNWCFTDFELLDWAKIWEAKEDLIRYMVWGEETCPKSKKKHMQGWLQLKVKKTLGGVKKLIGSIKTHLEACRGDEYDNDVYCKKDQKFTIKGKFVTQGQRTDLEGIKEMLDEGVSMKKVADANWEVYCKYHRAFDKYEQMVIKSKTKEFRHVDVTVLKGPTGCGKTRIAVESEPEDYYKIQGDELKWFDGYEQQNTLVIDEYDNQINITKLLSLLDGYQLRLPIKGGFTYANWTKVYITTNVEEMHLGAKKEHKEALKRRVTRVVSYFKEKEDVNDGDEY